jgi:hypothetical protein
VAYVVAFVAGFLSTLVFHQGAVAILHSAGALPFQAFGMAPTAPLGVPAVISLAFWGGVWGIPLWVFVRNATGGAYWLRALLFGAIAPTAVALLVVFPLKGIPLSPRALPVGLFLNGLWGLGTALPMLLYKRAH